MNLLRLLWKFLTGWRAELKARTAKYLVTREVVKALQVTHAQELLSTPRNEWVMVKQRQVAEVQAARDNNSFDIVDRHSWAYPYLPEALHRLNQPVLKNCFSADTEFLTGRGWVFGADLKKSDVFATRKRNGRFIWLLATKIYSYQYKGIMLHFAGRRLDYLVTPDHRMLGRVVRWASPAERKSLGQTTVPGDVGMMFAQDIDNLTGIGNGEPFQVPLTSRWKGTKPEREYIVLKQTQGLQAVGRKPDEFKVPLKQWVGFLGLYLAEGCHTGAFDNIEKDPTKDKRPLYIQSMAAAADNATYDNVPHGRGIHIAQQKHNGSYKEVKRFLKSLPFGFHYHAGGFQKVSAALWEAVHPLGDVYNKHIPHWVKQLPPEYLEELVKWYWIGDGSKSDRTCGTASKQLADDLQEVFQKIGKWATILTGGKKPLENGRTTAPFYTLCVGDTPFGGVGKSSTVSYDGMVYCPAIPETGTVFVRRDGKAGWCGQTPYNIRRFSETPIPRRATNLVKNACLQFKWEIKPTKEFVDDDDPDREKRIRVATETLKRPNNTGESFRDLLEMALEDFLLIGMGVIEHRTTPYFKRPTKFWAVDGSTLRMFLDWTESAPDRPRYAQMTGLKGERGIVTFLSDELMVIRDNIRTATPFGLGRLEVAFNSVNAFLGVQDMSAKAGADQIHKTWLWWEQTINTAHIQQLRRQVMNELEGQSKLAMVAGVKAPKTIDIKPVTIEDFMLDWQKFLIVIIAAAYDLSPQALNLDEHPTKATAQVMADSDWKSAVVPVATRFQAAFTRQWLHDDLGWKDLEFEFQNLDDPDPVTRVVIDQRMYTMDSITSNEIRKKNNLPQLPGPWGKLTMMQKQLLLVEAQAKLMGKTTSSGGTGQGAPSGGMSSGGGASSAGSLGTGGSMSFSAQDIAQMDPETIQMYYELGLLPDPSTLPQQMEQQQPGILDQISDELTEYFQKLQQDELETEILPAPVTNADESMQVKKFYQDSPSDSLIERTINKRGTLGPNAGPKNSKNAVRGIYKRNPDGRLNDQAGKDRVLQTGQPNKRYKPGPGNKRI